MSLETTRGVTSGSAESTTLQSGRVVEERPVRRPSAKVVVAAVIVAEILWLIFLFGFATRFFL